MAKGNGENYADSGWSDASAPYEYEAPAEKYAVTVNNGKGGGRYAAGATVTITANAPAEGKRFKAWTVDSGNVTLASAASASTTFTMPAGDVTVTAVYENAPAPLPAPTPTPKPAPTQPTDPAIDLNNMRQVEKGVNEFVKELRKLNADMPKNAAYQNGTELVVNMNRLDGGIDMSGVDYEMLANSGIETLTLINSGVQALLDVKTMKSEKPAKIDLVCGDSDDKPASGFGFVNTADDMSVYIVGVNSVSEMILPVETNGPYEITINGKVHKLTVSLINGKKVIKLPAVTGPGIFEIKLHED